MHDLSIYTYTYPHTYIHIYIYICIYYIYIYIYTYPYTYSCSYSYISYTDSTYINKHAYEHIALVTRRRLLCHTSHFPTLTHVAYGRCR